MLKFGIVIRVFIVLVLIVLFGSTAMNLIATIFNWIASTFKWLGSIVDFFGWGGVF